MLEAYNPRLKATILEVVDNQMRDNNPPITNETFKRLVASGNTPQQAKEKIAAIVVEFIFDAMKFGKEFDEAKYTKKLLKLK